MKVIIDGRNVRDFPSFVDEFVKGAAIQSNANIYFGFDLHSFGDCLNGGYLGSPPYDIVVENGQDMIRSMNHDGLARYCDSMLAIIQSGGRGLVQEDSRPWYESMQAQANNSVGETLLDLLCEVIQAAPASISFLDDKGQVILKSIGKQDNSE